MHGQTADNCGTDEPTGRRTEMTLHHAKAQRLRHRVKYQRGLATHPRAPAGTEARARSLQRLNQGTGFNGRAVKVNGTSAREKLDLCPGLEKERSQVDGGGPCAEHGYAAASKPAQITVPATMTHPSLGQICEQRRHISEIHDAGSNHDQGRSAG